MTDRESVKESTVGCFNITRPLMHISAQCLAWPSVRQLDNTAEMPLCELNIPLPECQAILSYLSPFYPIILYSNIFYFCFNKKNTLQNNQQFFLGSLHCVISVKCFDITMKSESSCWDLLYCCITVLMIVTFVMLKLFKKYMCHSVSVEQEPFCFFYRMQYTSTVFEQLCVYVYIPYILYTCMCFSLHGGLKWGLLLKSVFL